MLPEPTPLNEYQLRQYINAKSAAEAFLDARKEALQVRGGMLWKEEAGRRYLVRTSSTGGQRGLGAESPQTLELYGAFQARKALAEERLQGLKEAMKLNQRLNKAHQVGRVPNIVVKTLNAFRDHGIEDHFMTVGTHALYAYEAAAGLRLAEGYLATNDIDLFYDAQKHMRFIISLRMSQTTLLGILRSVDKTFKVRSDQKYTAVNAVNSAGFEIDVIRRPARQNDAHPMMLSGSKDFDEDAMWAVQVGSGDKLASSGRFRQLVVATNGEMALMETIDPLAFIRIKSELSTNKTRDPLKRAKDAQQASIVQWMVDEARLIPQSSDRAVAKEERLATTSTEAAASERVRRQADRGS